MEFKVLGTGSKGNGYMFVSEIGNILLLEAGINPKELISEIKGETSRITALLLTHEHADHARYLRKYIEMGIDVYSAKETFVACGISDFSRYYNVHTVEANKRYRIGEYQFMPFKIQHDCANGLGYIIRHEETGDILFATDTGKLSFKIPNLNTIICEANFDTQIIENRIYNGTINPFLAERIQETHLSIDRLCDFINSQDKKNIQQIVLIHLSDSNSNEQEFVKTIESETGICCTAVDKGSVLSLDCY